MAQDHFTPRAPRPPQAGNPSSHQVQSPRSPLSRHTCCTGLHWPLKVTRAHACCWQVHKVPELLTGPGSSQNPAYRTRPRCSSTPFSSRASTGASPTSTSGLRRCSWRRRAVKVWVQTGPHPLMRGGGPVGRSQPRPLSRCAWRCSRRAGRSLRLTASAPRCRGGSAAVVAMGWGTRSWAGSSARTTAKCSAPRTPRGALDRASSTPSSRWRRSSGGAVQSCAARAVVMPPWPQHAAGVGAGAGWAGTGAGRARGRAAGARSRSRWLEEGEGAASREARYGEGGAFRGAYKGGEGGEGEGGGGEGGEGGGQAEG